jgi:UDP-N-acetylglucosamine 1-carboxyvinyltransferase
LEAFIEKIRNAGGGIEAKADGIRFYSKGGLQAVDIVTDIHPGFMTDWQGPWAVLMTQAEGESIIHERIFENRFSYVDELRKLGAKIQFFEPEVANPADFYHFSSKEGDFKKNLQAIKIYGKSTLHNGVMNVADLRAGATLLIAATVAEGESIVDGASNIDRGYENIEGKLQQLGADIRRV